MTQHKAAALTSSLFARKGKASPASLLIADLDAAAPRRQTKGRLPKLDPLRAAVNGDLDGAVHGPTNGSLNGGAGGEGAALPVAALNGRAGRHKAKPAAAELPLLAFVAAQEAADSDKTAADEAASEPAPETTESQSAARRAAVFQDDLRPAASLLERGSQVLGRAKTEAAGLAAERPGSEAIGEDAAQERGAGAVAAAADGASDRAETAAEDQSPIEPETVSGDGNVAAIEDLPPDSAVAPPAQASAAEAPQAEPAAKEAAAPAAAAATGGAGSAISATVALRKAAAHQTTRTPPLAAATGEPPAQPVRPLPWIAVLAARWRPAAVVALGVVLGLGAYIAISDNPAPKMAGPGVAVPQAAGPAASAPMPEPVPVEAPVEAPIEAPVEAAVAEPAAPPPTAPQAAVSAVPQPLPEPSFDVIRIEPDGQSIIAGRALPFSEWILLNNGRPIASIRADANGEWVVLPDAALVPGANAFSLVPKTERGKVAIPAKPQTPAPAPATEQEAPLGPRSEAVPAGGENFGAVAGAITLPKPKPDSPHRAAAIGVTPGGAYEVQVASVRQNADAQRELARLTTAYPAQLGRLDLRVQKASVEGAGTFYRVRSGAIEDLGAAREVCRQLDAVGQGCLVVRRAPQAQPAQSEVVEEASPLGSSVRQQAERPQ